VGTDHSQVRLCLAKDLSDATRYLTLSHCWGREKFTTLTSDNLEKFYSGIPDVALSKTFIDAMKVTRELGFKYLWIDSLCIIQDNKGDWNQEAALMGTVYANSCLNLAAVDAHHGGEGCFFPRTSRKVYSWKVGVYEDQGTQTITTWNCYPWNYAFRCQNDNILSTRAWVFQERCLASRTLCFGKKELTWQCRETAASETLPNGLHYHLTIPGIISTQWHEPMEIWPAVVSDYSQGELTFDSDKLVAVSGIARPFVKRFETSYLAGLWRKNLVLQLTWYAWNNPQPAV
jgi:hypothetical protein